jgi:hypothetical protein
MPEERAAGSAQSRTRLLSGQLRRQLHAPGQVAARTSLPASTRCSQVPPVTRQPQRYRRLYFFLLAGLGLITCRPKSRPGIAAGDIAGRWVIDVIGYTGAGVVPQWLGAMPRDTLTIFADGRWWTSRDSTYFTMRHDSLVLPADTGEAVYLVRLIGPGEPRLSFSRRSTYDFNADGLPEWAVQETVFHRVDQARTSRTR